MSNVEQKRLPRIAVTIGDPAGVGPEISLKAIADQSIQKMCQPILLGDLVVIQEVARQLNLGVPETVISQGGDLETGDRSRPVVVDLKQIQLEDFTPQQVNSKTGAASFHYVDTAIAFAQAKKVDAMVTGPLHKGALNAAGHDYPGHTEILANRLGTDDFCMMLTSEPISCSFVTTHVGLHTVPDLLTEDRVLKTILLTDDALSRIRKRRPRLVCCGLNPHAGEGGLFGQGEEEKSILPAIEKARQKGVDILGPLPADTAFIASRRATTDGYVCMYNDQGSIPLKAIAFDEAVNLTLGLPIIRTSVDHGTACGLAWQDTASPSSMVAAIRLAVQLASVPSVRN